MDIANLFKKKNTMRFKLVLSVLIILVPMLLMILASSISSVRVVRQQVKSVNQSILNIHMKQIDQTLASAFQTVSVLAVTDADLFMIGNTNNSSVQYFAKYRLLSRLNDELAVYSDIFGYFIYSKEKNVKLERFQSSANFPDKQAIWNFVMNGESDSGRIISEDYLADWDFAEILGQEYLIRAFEYNNQIVGACISISELLKPLNQLNLGETGFVVITDKNDNPVINKSRVHSENISLKKNTDSDWVYGENSRYFAIDVASEISSFKITVLYPEDELFQGFNMLIRLLLLICIVSLILVPLGMFRINRIFIKPLKKLTLAMQSIGSGNLDYRLELKPDYDELSLVSNTFNTMTQEIEQLRINVYEEQIQKQQAELQYTQLQIRPHFLFNSLSVLYSLVQLNKTALVKELTLCLVSHFRYILRDGLTLARLDEELEHVKNYLRIQELRLPGTLRVEIQIQPDLEKYLIPPLLIHTLLENSIKHAVVIGETIKVTLIINKEKTIDSDKIHILLKDTGKGFADDILQILNAEKEIVDFDTKHIGIQNIRHRLRYLYGNRAKLEFYNNSDGEACNEVYLPANADSNRSEMREKS